MNEIAELIKGLTGLANAATIYFERLNNPELPLTPAPAADPADTTAPAAAPGALGSLPGGPQTPPPAASAPATTAAKSKRTRKKKTAAPAPVAEMTEEESSKAVLDLAKKFVERFKNVTQANPVGGLDQLRAFMHETFKAGKMSDLVHAQRLQLITLLTGKIEEADKVPA